MAKEDNLIPFTSEQNREEAKINGRKGGIRSGEVRREKATMKKTLEMLLDGKNKKGITYRELATLGLIQGAVKGNAQNYKIMLELLGELNEVQNLEEINSNIKNIAKLISNPVENRTEDSIDE